MQITKDVKIILDLDGIIETNRLSTLLECSLSQWQQKHSEPLGRVKIELNSSQRGELFTIQFESLEHFLVLLASEELLVEIGLLANVSNEDEDRWTLSTRGRPRKKNQVKPSPFRYRKNKVGRRILIIKKG